MTRTNLKVALRLANRTPVVGHAYRAIVSASRRIVAVDQGLSQSMLVERASPDPIAVASGLTGLVVKNGPFAGMRYARTLAECRTFYPKLLGSYEAELSPHFERVLQTKYSAIVDVGCADGYFAVGFALKKRDVVVYAYDTDPSEREICAANAAVNGVSDRVRIGTFCDANTLLKLDLGDRAFILCDCEGFERELFPERVVAHLAPHDLLIELHDFIDISIRDILLARFSATHHAVLVDSVDDSLKGDVFPFPELAGKSRALKIEAMSERRPCIMQWLVLASRLNA
jgi:SAM-dependent methyltransferase